ISFALANGPGNVRDWVGLFSTSAADTAFASWEYLNNLKTAPFGGIATAALQFTAPTVAGTYDIRLFSNDSFTKLVTSAAITVQAAAPPPPPPPPSGPTLTVTQTTV